MDQSSVLDMSMSSARDRLPSSRMSLGGLNEINPYELMQNKMRDSMFS
jgi:hypothetical protein